MDRKNAVIITPTLAAQYLATSKGNRDLRKSHVALLAKQMTDGLFVYNGDVIRFDTDGCLCDGHHRLTAVVDSGVSIVTDIVTVSDAAKCTIDKGVGRTLGDNLVFEAGTTPKESRTIAAVTRMLMMHDLTGLLDWGASTIPSSYASLRIIKHQIDYFEDNKDSIQRAVKWVTDMFKNSGKNNTAISAAKYAAVLVAGQRMYDERGLKLIIKQVATGYVIEEGTPAAHTRNFALGLRTKTLLGTNTDAFLTLCKTINAVFSGRPKCQYPNALFRSRRDCGSSGEVDFRRGLKQKKIE